MASEDIPARPGRKQRPKWAKAAYASAGAMFFAIGAVGIVTPGLPTTIFWIIAAGFLLKANPGAVRPILRTPMIGPLIIKTLRWRPWPTRRKRTRPAQ